MALIIKAEVSLEASAFLFRGWVWLALTLDLTHKIYEATRVTATMKEMENFCNRYVRTLKLKIVDGKFSVEIQR